MQYKIYSSRDLQTFMYGIQANLDRGWQLQGGVSISLIHVDNMGQIYITVYAQALVSNDMTLIFNPPRDF